MSVQITVKAQGIEIVPKRLEDFDEDIPRVGAGRIYGRMFAAMNRAKKYPAISKGRRQPFRTEKSRRFFFWALKQGLITVPYQRTGTYARAWKLTRNPSRMAKSDGYTLSARAVQRGKDYTALVGGSATGEGQATFHKDGGWPLVQAIVEEEAAKLPPEISGALVLAARRRGL